MSVYRTFCKCNEDISGSYDLINLWNGFRSICKSRDCLCAACLVDSSRTGFICCNQCSRIYFTLAVTRSGHYYIFNTCYLCRHNVHQYGRWIHSFSARYIYSDRFQCCYLLSKHDTFRIRIKPAVLTLFFVIGTNVFFCFSDNLDQLLINLCISIFNLFFCNQNISGIDICFIKLLCISK